MNKELLLTIAFVAITLSSFAQTGWVKWTSQPVELKSTNIGTVVIGGVTYTVVATATTNQNPPSGVTYDNPDSNDILDGGQGYFTSTSIVPTLTEGTYSPGFFCRR